MGRIRVLGGRVGGLSTQVGAGEGYSTHSVSAEAHFLWKEVAGVRIIAKLEFHNSIMHPLSIGLTNPLVIFGIFISCLLGAAASTVCLLGSQVPTSNNRRRMLIFETIIPYQIQQG